MSNFLWRRRRKNEDQKISVESINPSGRTVDTLVDADGNLKVALYGGYGVNKAYPLDVNAPISDEAVPVTFPTGTQIGINNFPATQNIAGSVEVTNLGSDAAGTLHPGTALSVAPGAQITILNIITTATSPIITSIQASGDTDAVYILIINNQNQLRFITNIVNPNVQFDVPILLHTGDSISIAVINEGTVSANFYANILGTL